MTCLPVFPPEAPSIHFWKFCSQRKNASQFYWSRKCMIGCFSEWINSHNHPRILKVVVLELPRLDTFINTLTWLTKRSKLIKVHCLRPTTEVFGLLLSRSQTAIFSNRSHRTQARINSHADIGFHKTRKRPSNQADAHCPQDAILQAWPPSMLLPIFRHELMKNPVLMIDI